MGMLNELKDLREERARLAGHEWSVQSVKARLFYDSGGRTGETDPPTELIAQALHLSEHSGASLSYYGAKFVGSAVKKAVLHLLDKQIRDLSESAREEAEAVMKITSDRDVSDAARIGGGA